jgi:hypothetical protein
MKLLDFGKRGGNVNKPQPVRLVAVEDGAHGFESRVAPDGGDETVVVTQWSGEPPESLIGRVAARIVALERSGKKVDRAILLIGQKRNPHTIAARRLVARALLSHLHSSSGTELVLDAVGAPANVRHELLSEVESLIEESERPSVPIRLQFRHERAPSGDSGIYSTPSASEGPLRATAGGRA